MKAFSSLDLMIAMLLTLIFGSFLLLFTQDFAMMGSKALKLSADVMAWGLAHQANLLSTHYTQQDLTFREDLSNYSQMKIEGARLDICNFSYQNSKIQATCRNQDSSQIAALNVNILPGEMLLP
ncbi:MAG: hypothetical protein QW097_02580 [archaeon]